MNKRLNAALNLKDIFYHEYDFGSTTYLDGHLLALREGFKGKIISAFWPATIPMPLIARIVAKRPPVCVLNVIALSVINVKMHTSRAAG